MVAGYVGDDVPPRDYKPKDLADLDDALEVLARSSDPSERMLAQFTVDRMRARREAQQAAIAKARAHVHDPPTTPAEKQAGQQEDGKL